jgi:hypothetical protein
MSTATVNIARLRFRVINTMVVLVVITGVLQNLFEIGSLFLDNTFNFTTYEGPLVFKIFKDVFVAFLIMFSLVFGWSKKCKPLTPETIFCMLMIALLFFLSSMANGVMIAAAGLRWFLPVLLFMVFRGLAGNVKIEMLTKLLYTLLSVCVVLQVLQLFFMPPLYGTIGSGLAARVPGFFIFPNTTAFFASVATSCVLVFGTSRFMRASSIILCAASSGLAQSGTGILVSILLVLFYFFGRYRKLILCVAPLVLIPLLFFLDEITGRGDFLALSGGGRLEVFSRIVSTTFTSYDSFGLFTNTGVLMSGRFFDNGNDLATVADSMFAAMAGNLGMYSLLVMFSLACYIKKRTEAIDWLKLMPIVAVYFLFSFTTIISEAYPMNLLLTFLMWSSPTLAIHRADTVACGLVNG